MNVICVCKFGWRVFGNITKAQKSLFCTGLQNLGIMAIPRQSHHILTKGHLTVGLHVIARDKDQVNIFKSLQNETRISKAAVSE